MSQWHLLLPDEKNQPSTQNHEKQYCLKDRQKSVCAEKFIKFIKRKKIPLRLIVRSIVWKRICIIKRMMGRCCCPLACRLDVGELFLFVTLCRFLPRGIRVRS